MAGGFYRGESIRRCSFAQKARSSSRATNHAPSGDSFSGEKKKRKAWQRVKVKVNDKGQLYLRRMEKKIRNS